MAASKKKPEKSEPPDTQLERAMAAIGQLPRFDKLRLERLEQILAETRDAKLDDKSIPQDVWLLAENLLERAREWNALRAHAKFPKSWVPG